MALPGSQRHQQETTTHFMLYNMVENRLTAIWIHIVIIIPSLMIILPMFQPVFPSFSHAFATPPAPQVPWSPVPRHRRHPCRPSCSYQRRWWTCGWLRSCGIRRCWWPKRNWMADVTSGVIPSPFYTNKDNYNNHLIGIIVIIPHKSFPIVIIT